MFSDRRLNIGIVISIVIHIIIFIFMSGSTSSSQIDYEDIKEITFIDQSYRPEVAKVVSKGSIWKTEEQTYHEATPSGPGSDIATPVIDLHVKVDRSQANIDLNRYLPSSEITDVVKIGNRNNGTMKSTDEILAESPISLAKTLPRGTGEGVTGTSNIGRPALAPTIKIDKKPPPVRTTEPTKVAGAEVDEKIEVKKGETKISLAGPIVNRAVLYKTLPHYPSWCLSKNISGVVKIRIWVEPSGMIREGTLIDLSSGYPDLDQAVVDAVKTWRFAPLPSEVLQEVQWGVITFRFVCG